MTNLTTRLREMDARDTPAFADDLMREAAGEIERRDTALTRIATIVRTNWGDDALSAIGKVLDESVPGWLDRRSPVEPSEKP